jgi:hypothetical protein
VALSGRARFLAASLITVTICGAGWSWGEVPARSNADGLEFSARVVWKTEGEIKDALLFVKGARYRLEHRGGVRTDLGYAGVTIVRQDRNELWYVLSQRRLYVAVPLSLAHLLPFNRELEGEVGRARIGEAMSGGRPADLYEVVVQRYGRREGFFEWVDVETGLLLKLVSKHRNWSVEYEHVVFSSQPNYYFEVPRGYRRVEAQEQLSQPE